MNLNRLGGLARRLYGQERKPVLAGGQEPGRAHTLARGATVAWAQAGRRPHGDVEDCLYAALARGPLPLDGLIDRLAERLFQIDSRHASESDIGFLGPSLYRAAAAELVWSLDGLTLRIDRNENRLTGD
jgi:hypothetical protein